MSNPFTKHPNEVGFSYFQHFLFAWILAGKLLMGFFCSIIHSFFPFIFTNTTSNMIEKLNKKIQLLKSNH